MRARILALAAGFAAGFAGLAQAAPGAAWYRCQETVYAESAIEACSRILATPGEPAESLGYALTYRGLAHLERHDYDAAARDFTAAVAHPPALAHAWFGLGEVWSARGDWAQAADAYAKAAASQAEDADVGHFTSDSLGSFRHASLAGLAYAHFKAGAAAQALADLDAAEAACPSCVSPPRLRGFILATAHRFPEAYAALDKAIALDPRDSRTFFFRGVARAYEGRSEAAIADYDEALRLDPADAEAAQARGRAYVRLGKSDPGAAAAPAAGPALDQAALVDLVGGKTWQAVSGPWKARLEFRADGSFRERLTDPAEAGGLDLSMDGAWSAVDGQLCLYTNRRLCMTAHRTAGEVVLAGERGETEYSGRAAAFAPTTADNASDPIREFPLREEFRPGGQPRAGPGRTLLYYMHGFDGRTPHHSPLLEYFLGRIQETKGWDVIDADYPLDVGPSGQVMRHEAANFGSAVFVARRLRELKAQGYARLIVGGQSWGGWTSLVLSTEPGLPLDASLLIVPACCGWTVAANFRDRELKADNTTLFNQLITRVRYPTVAVFFQHDKGEVADRGPWARQSLGRSGVANLVIDHPDGLFGHGAGWLPAFDYEFGDCIAVFLLGPPRTGSKTADCTPPPLSHDFRLALLASDLGEGKGAVAKDLAGRRFAVWPEGSVRQVTADGGTRYTSYSLGEARWPSAFRDGDYCWRGRVQWLQPVSTDEECLALARWSDHQLVGVDPKTGRAVQWWTEIPNQGPAPASPPS
jgi:tetratricopeptide (TPR) repeat protein